VTSAAAGTVPTSLSNALADRYRIERELGTGGMAIVYLAHDLKHDRRVALKVLRHELAAVIGGARFLAEIKLTANLQHPHILPLHDSGEADGTVFYVMPYVEGETLRHRLDREKQLPIDDAVRIARQVAGALDYAHRHNVIHRDIKPENILLHDGQALVADFGIALAAANMGASRMTETGMSLGTPKYMSPEQAMGERSLDGRTDVYALGCVVYEMLTGEPPFTGPTAQSIVARVMTDTPRQLRLQRQTIPPHVEAAVSRALEKLPADRFASAADFSVALADASVKDAGEPRTGAPLHAATRSSARRTYALVALSAVLAVMAAWGWLRQPPAGRVMRYSVILPQAIVDLFLSGADVPTLSPDGRRLAFTGNDGRLFIRDENDLKAVPLPGTENAWSPAFSLDGSSIAYIVGFPGDLKVVSLNGGSPVTLVRDSAWASGVSWSEDGWLYYPGERGGAIMRVRTSGGAPELVTRADTTKDELFLFWPSAINDGRALLFTIWRRRGTPDIAVMNLRTKRVQVLTGGVRALLAATGHLLVIQGDGRLVGVPFDARRLVIEGQPKPLIEGLRVPQAGRTFLAVSANGTLFYDASRPTQAVVRVTRDGVATGVDDNWTGDFNDLTLSPDGSRLGMVVSNQGRDEIWVKTLDKGPVTRVASVGSRNARPAWLADGRTVSFTTDVNAKYELYRAPADGAGTMQRVLSFGRSVEDAAWSRDGKWLVFRAGSGGGRHLYGIHIATDSVPRPLVASEFEEFSPALSPDGRWLAYASNASGSDEVYVVAFPNSDGDKVQVSATGGSEPVWANSGRELFYRNAAGDLVAVAVEGGPQFRATGQRVLFSAKGYLSDNRSRDYAISPDDRSFYFLRPKEPPATSMVIVQNWFEEVRAKLAR
jgi:serine/threonine-protein kinase